MFILQDGNIYIQKGARKLIGVDIYADKILEVKGTDANIKKSHTILTPFEVKRRLNIREDNPYKFPTPPKAKKEVKKDVKSTGKAKAKSGKS